MTLPLLLGNGSFCFRNVRFLQNAVLSTGCHFPIGTKLMCEAPYTQSFLDMTKLSRQARVTYLHVRDAHFCEER